MIALIGKHKIIAAIIICLLLPSVWEFFILALQQNIHLKDISWLFTQYPSSPLVWRIGDTALTLYSHAQEGTDLLEEVDDAALTLLPSFLLNFFIAYSFLFLGSKLSTTYTKKMATIRYQAKKL